MAPPAQLSIVLHAHLPFIRHPEHEYHLEEMWYYEAMHETYLPLLQVLDRLERDQIPGSMTLSLSAPLLAMMDDPLLGERFADHLDRLVAFSDEDRQRLHGDPDLAPVAAYYRKRFADLRNYYVDELDGDVISAFSHHADADRLELMCCVGTHPILPFAATEAGQRAQIRIGLDAFESHFGFRPRGMWIAECAFAPGIDRLLADQGIGFACLEERAISCADSAPVYGTYGPVISDGGIAFFGRDQFAGSQVWSASEGYPGDPIYREFYRDRGYDLPVEVLQPHFHPEGIRHDTGLKYHRITGDVALDDKAPYDPNKAKQRVGDHARHFVDARINQVEVVSDSLAGRTAHITCPYDAELFGHWWFEGPLFLEHLFRRTAERPELTLTTPPQYLADVDIHQQTTPAVSTWGEEGYFSVWLDESNAWIYRPLRNAEQKMVALADEGAPSDSWRFRALQQAARELVLAQGSDWPFIIKTGTTVEYAEGRLDDHLANFERLAQMLDDGDVDHQQLASLEDKNNLFPDIDPGYWRPI